MRLTLSLCIAIALIAEAHAEEASNTWTLESGVKLLKVEECKSSGNKQSISVRGSPKEYLIGIRAFFPCDGKTNQPYLTVPTDGKATLVLSSSASKSSCECMKSLAITLASRLSKGDTLYVVNEHEVVGHATAP
jgi:hypothetical protein